MEMTMDSLPKLRSFFGIELELGVKIVSLVLAVSVFVLHPKDLCGDYYCLGGLLGGFLLQNLLGVPAGIRMVLWSALLFLASPTSGLLEPTLATLSVERLCDVDIYFLFLKIYFWFLENTVSR